MAQHLHSISKRDTKLFIVLQLFTAMTQRFLNIALKQCKLPALSLILPLWIAKYPSYWCDNEPHVSIMGSDAVGEKKRYQFHGVCAYLKSQTDFPGDEFLPGVEDNRIAHLFPFTVSFYLSIQRGRFTSLGVGIVWTHRVHLRRYVHTCTQTHMYTWINRRHMLGKLEYFWFYLSKQMENWLCLSRQSFTRAYYMAAAPGHWSKCY